MNDGSAPWIKIVSRIFEDPKIIAIGELPESNGILVIWFKLLCLAGLQNRTGAIYFTESVSFTPELLAAKWRCKPALVQMALTVFQKFGMIGIDDEGTIWILNWSKYQNEAAMAQIRERSLLQLEDRSPERNARVRELAAARQRKRRQKQKQQATSGAVTRHAAVTRDGSVTVTPKSYVPQRGTVTLQNQNKKETKSIEEPPTVPQGTERNGKQSLEEAKAWINTFFGRQREWSYEEIRLLSELLPISKEDRALLSWAYTLPLDREGWVIHNGNRLSKRKESVLLLLEQFGSELDKWRGKKQSLGPRRVGVAVDEPIPPEWAAIMKKLYGPETPIPPLKRHLPPSVREDIDAELERKECEWTKERRAAFEKMFPGGDPGPFYLLDREMRERIDKTADQMTREPTKER